MRLLLVEDDPMIGAGLQQALRRAGHAVDWTPGARGAIAALQAERFEMVLLDLGLPGGDGMGVLRELRRRADTVPVIIITAREELDSKVKGLDAGADDYLVKPFAVEELLARIRTVARRRADLQQPAELRAGPLRMDTLRHIVWLDDIEVTLSLREFAILQLLMRAGKGALPREQIEQRVYGWDAQVESNAVEVHIHNLRKKLGTEVIQNVRGVGYRVREAA